MSKTLSNLAHVLAESQLDASQLDAVTDLLNTLASPTESPLARGALSVMLRNGRTVDIWQGSNESYFKWAYTPTA
jgi:hypothetical protein